MIDILPKLGSIPVEEQLQELVRVLKERKIPLAKYSRLLTDDSSSSISSIHHFLMKGHMTKIHRNLRGGPIRHTFRNTPVNYDDVISSLSKIAEVPDQLLLRFIDRSRVEHARLYGTDRDELSRTDWHLGALERESRKQYVLDHFHEGRFTYASPLWKDFNRRIDRNEALLIYSGSALQSLKPDSIGDENHNSYGFHVFTIPSPQRALLAVIEPSR